MTIKYKNHQINEITKKIVEKFDPEKIILFGSYAWGKPGPDSDVDLLIVKDTKIPPIKRMTTLRDLLWGSDMAMDLLVYTPTEVQNMIRQDRNLFIEDIVKNGKILYAKN
ncbi:MAG: hypothetical protein UX98_C0003G0021 [Parcubacteria group bacterium GW2011_GWA2_47_26]|nr:MAG: hypothetical protein UX98_C0003G0021 [Parcubacteria group bacterium GW2011_GWA2_47_26]